MINNVSELLNPSSSFSSFSKCKNNKINLLANTALQVFSDNPKRKYAAFVNNGDSDITLVLDDKSKAVLEAGIVLKGKGGSYEITLLNLYTGKISVISAATTQLSVVEGFE